ncbi:MAG: DUF3817 domain-containing protein [Chitinophagaceae bacterium]
MDSSKGIKTLHYFRKVAFFEGFSYILLGFTMYLKYQQQMPLPNYIVGLAHGFLFIAYVGLLLQLAIVRRWNLFMLTVAFIASLIPFGTFYADKKWFQHG